jgi:hypothetical protein
MDNKTDEEIAAAIHAAETEIPPAGEATPGPEPVQGGGWATNARYAWQYRPQFDPSPNSPPMIRIAAAFESIATSLQILSEAQMTLAQDAVYNTEHR